VKFERSTSITALIVSVFAIGLSLWQGFISREHNKLSLAPYLQVSPKLVGGKESGLYIENAGTGTAFIKSVNINVDGKTFDLTKNSWSDLFEYIKVNPICYKKRWLKVGSAIRAGNEVVLISMTDADLPLCVLSAIKFLTTPEMRLSISYT